MSRDRRGETRAHEEENEVGSTALVAATRGLENCLRDWSRSGPDDRLAEALRYNLRLWTLFQCDLSRPDHGFLPRLRTDLLERFTLVERRTFEIMSEPSSAKLRSLIAINRDLPVECSTWVPAPFEAPVSGERGTRP